MDIPLNLDPKSPEPLYLQLYEGIKEGILNGRFHAGWKLPASRTLARSVGVSRITVTGCYDRLIAEGYLDTRRGSGTYVCRKLPELSLFAPQKSSKRPGNITNAQPPRLSRYGAAVDISLRRVAPPHTLRFDRHGPDVSHFPRKVWAKILARRIQESGKDLFDYAYDSRGNGALRSSVAEYLAKARAAACDPDQILIVSGSQQAIYLSARILLNEGDRVAMESPGYYFAGRAFSAQGAEVVPIPVDRNGIDVAKLRKQQNIRMVYVTPSHQFPTGVSLSISRRRALIAWARENNAFILEDDYDSEFRYKERPLPALQGLHDDAPVIYTGSFSKMLFPSIRLGYLVLPRQLLTAFRTAKLLNDIHSSSFNEQILADFLAQGHLDSHLRRMRTLYDKRRQTLIKVLRDCFGRKLSISGDEAGMYLLAKFRVPFSEDQAYERALKAGVQMERMYWPGGVPESQPGYVRFVLAYGSLSEKQLQQAGRRLAAAFLS